MHALLRVIIKEFLQLRQDRKMIPVMIVGPVVQLLALGYAANLDVNLIPTLLVDQDRTAQSRQLVERFSGSGYFRIVGSEDGVSGIEPWLVEGRAQVGKADLWMRALLQRNGAGLPAIVWQRLS